MDGWMCLISCSRNSQPWEEQRTDSIWSPKYSHLLSCTWLWSCWNDLNNNNNNTLSLEKRKEGRKARKAERMIQNWLLRYKTKKQTKFLTTSSHFQARAPKLFLPPLPPPTHTPWKTLLHTWWILSSDFIAGSWGQLVVNLCTQKKPRHILQQWFFFFGSSESRKCSQSNSQSEQFHLLSECDPAHSKLDEEKSKSVGLAQQQYFWRPSMHLPTVCLLSLVKRAHSLTHSLTQA